MSILFQSNGILTTLQDLGRIGFRRFGINPSGVMDDNAARTINILLGNDENEAVLEMHFPAPILQFEESCEIALGGADFPAILNEKPLENWRRISIQKGDILKFRRRKFGARLYLAVRGGFQVEKWLGSASANLRANVGKRLGKGDRLFFRSNFKSNGSKFHYKLSSDLIPFYSRFPTVRVVAGAEWENLTEESRKIFLSQSFAVRNESDRMGFRLKGEILNLRENFEIVSTAVNFGTIQLLPDGQLIILMADHQTTGGYPRPANVAKIDLPLLAQLNPNDTVNFHLISVAEAENLLVQREIELNYLRTAVRFL